VHTSVSLLVASGSFPLQNSRQPGRLILDKLLKSTVASLASIFLPDPSTIVSWLSCVDFSTVLRLLGLSFPFSSETEAPTWILWCSGFPSGCRPGTLDVLFSSGAVRISARILSCSFVRFPMGLCLPRYPCVRGCDWCMLSILSFLRTSSLHLWMFRCSAHPSKSNFSSETCRFFLAFFVS
jgi:hypothetical protein